MAKEVRNFKLSDLNCAVPDSGQYEGLTYEYAGLKKSLKDEGYKPDKYDYIAVTDAGKVLYGGRRVWLMQKDMSMDQSTEVACEIWLEKEFKDDLIAKLDVGDYMAKKRAKGMTLPKKKIVPPHVKGYSALQDYHKKKSDIAGYPYDYKNSAGEKVDAGKS